MRSSGWREITTSGCSGGAGTPAAAGLEAREPLGRPPASSESLPASDVRPAGWADLKEYGRTHGPNQSSARLQED